MSNKTTDSANWIGLGTCYDSISYDNIDSIEAVFNECGYLDSSLDGL
jgi:hypothetical protein